MNELLREVISYILEKGESERKTREVGETWQTDSGKWSAKSKDRTQGGFASREAAEAWLSGTGPAPDAEVGDATSSTDKKEKKPSGQQDKKGAGKKSGTGGKATPKVTAAADITPSIGADASSGPSITPSVGKAKTPVDSSEGEQLFPEKTTGQRKALLAGLATARDYASTGGRGKGKATPEQQKNAQEFVGDMERLLALRVQRDEAQGKQREKLQREMTTLAQEMKDKYKLYSNPAGTQFKGADSTFGRNQRKILGDNGTSMPKLAVQIFDECGVSLKDAGDARKQLKQDVTTASKPKLGEPVTGPEVDKVFDSMGVPVKRTDRGVFGPTDENGKLIDNSDGRAAREYARHSVDGQRDTLKTLADKLRSAKPPRPEMADALEAHSKRMDALMNDDSMWPDPDTQEARNRRRDNVDESFSSMAIALADPSENGDPELAAGMLKNLGETFLYQREIAEGKQAYLPSSGNFPVADKLVVTPDGTGGERVQRISIKFGENSGGSVGMPAQSKGYMELTTDDFFGGTCRGDNPPKNCSSALTSGHPGEDGFDAGIRDDAVTTEGMGKITAGAGVDGVLDTDQVTEYTAKIGACVKTKKASGSESYEAMAECDKEHAEEGRKVLFGDPASPERRAALVAQLGESAVATMERNPSQTAGVLATMAVIRQNDGFPNVDHCGMAIQKGKKATKKAAAVKPQFTQKCHTGSVDNMNCWRIDSRFSDPRAGGVRISYNCPKPA